MKKISGKIIALIAAVLAMVMVFASCELITVNVDKDMEQVVAEVQVKDAGKEKIYKRELVAGYVTYGYYYVQSSGYTVSDAYELVYNNLVNNKVIVQYAIQQIDGNNNHSDAVKAYLSYPADNVRTEYMNQRISYIDGLLKYVTELQIASSVYNAKASLNALVDSLDEDKQVEEKEKEDETVSSARAVPTEETKDGTVIDAEYAKANSLDEKTTEEELEEAGTLAAYETWQVGKYNAYSAVATTTSRKAAVKQFVEAFASYGIIGQDEYATLEGKQTKDEKPQFTLTNYSYYLDLLASNVESAIVTNYEEKLETAAKDEITNDALWADYQATYETQKEQYDKDLSAYETALDGQTEDSYILYHPTVVGGQYGYVANILIGLSDAATAALTDFKSKNTSVAAVEAYRNELLKSTVAKDQRATWVQSGYGEHSDKTNYTDYTFEDKYLKSAYGKANLNTYLGSFDCATDYSAKKTENKYVKDGENWKWMDVEEDDYVVKTSNFVPTEYSFAQFIEMFNAALTATAVAENNNTGVIADIKDKLDIIDDLLFAFNTDPGGLNKYLGYLYSPKTSASKYMKEFADAAAEVVAAGIGNYKIAATDYGYHIIICTEVVVPSTECYVGGENAFIADLANEGTLAYKFKKAKENANLDKLVSDIVTYSISEYIEGGSQCAITKHEKPLKNLILEEEDN